MIAVFRAMTGPWPGEPGADTEGFRDAADAVATVGRRAHDGLLSPDDLRRHRVASAALERMARVRHDALLAVDADDLVAHLLAARARSPDNANGALATVCPPQHMKEMALAYAAALVDTGDFGSSILDFLDSQRTAGRGLVITLQGELSLRRAPILRCSSRPPTPGPQTKHAAPEVAEALGRVPATADVVFAADRRRLDLVAKLRTQIRHSVATGEPLSIGSQAKHEVLTEVFRELFPANGPRGELRILHVDGSEAAAFPFGPSQWAKSEASSGKRLRLGLMSMRHSELDPDVSGYWFRNRLVSVNRPLAETDKFCEEETRRQLRVVADEGVTDLEIVHTGFEPAVIGFYRAVAAFSSRAPLRVHPFYLTGRGPIPGATWGGPTG